MKIKSMIKILLDWDIKFSQRLLLRKEQAILRRIASFLAHSCDSWYIEIILLAIWIFSKGKTHTVSAYFAGSIVIQALFIITI